MQIEKSGNREVELSGVPDEVNNILSGFQRLSEITQLYSAINNLSRWVNKRCGNCDKWRCSNLCPQEHNVNGRKRGPSMNSFGCNLFNLKSLQIKHYNDECKTLLDNKYMDFIPESSRPKLMEGAKMQIEKISKEVRYKISDGQYYIHATVTDTKVLFISSSAGKETFNFVHGEPEVVAAVGRMLIAASELVK